MRTIVSLLLLFSFVSFSQPNSKLKLGTPASILDDVIKANTRVTSVFTLLSSSAEKIRLDVEDFYYKDGTLSMSGKAQESENSDFILKGDRDEIYGWVLFKNRKIAYEYTTDDKKNVIVAQVPVSKVFCVDDFTELKTGYNPKIPDFLYKTLPPIPHIGDYPGTNVNELQSLPGATKVLYLNITGVMNGEDPISQTKDDIWKTWQCVAGGFSMFEVNVTTDPNVYEQAGVVNSGIAKFKNSGGTSSSPVHAFGTTSSSTVYRQDDGYGTGRTCTHELGHLLGVYDFGGSPGGTYFVGFPDFKWVPIMGNYWYGDPWNEDALFQWSKGEYNSSNTKENFLDSASKYLQYREDDIPETVPLTFTGTSQIEIENNYGQITPNTDSDGFTFEIAGNSGNVNLKIDRIEYLGGAMLDVCASILDESGTVIATHNADAARFALLETDLPEGKYTLLIEGGAEGTPQTGFSNYGSLGFYGIDGTISGGVTQIANNTYIDKSITVRPISSGAKINLDIPENSKVEKIALYSMSGVRLFVSNTRVASIDLHDFAAGIYVLSIVHDGTKMVRNIVKR